MNRIDAIRKAIDRIDERYDTILEEIKVADEKVKSLRDEGDKNEAMSAYWEGRLDALKYTSAILGL